MHVDHHALTVDIGDFEMEAFLKPQAAGVHGEKIDVVVESFDVGQKASDFFDTHKKCGTLNLRAQYLMIN